MRNRNRATALLAPAPERGGAVSRVLPALLVAAALFFAVDFFWSRKPTGEPVSALRELVLAQDSYFATVGEGRYAASLEELKEAGLIDRELGSGRKAGYVFSVSVDQDGKTFVISARPVRYGVPATYSYYADQTGVARYTSEDRAATAQDTPF